VESKDSQLGKFRECMWKASTFKAISPACVGYGPMSWPPRASIERIDHMLVFMGPGSLVGSFSIASLVGSREKFGMDPQIVLGALFLRSSDSVQLCR
jgi:hypothetical protein